MMYSKKQVADLLQVSPGTVARFVSSGELGAIDVSLRQGKKRRLRIPEDALSQFLERRLVHASPPRFRNRKRNRQQEVIDFFGPLKLAENGRRRFTITKVAEYLGITEGDVHQLIANGHLTAINGGGTSRENRRRIVEKELFVFVERRRNPTNAASVKTQAMQ
jgi:excisionase family DNA binding protein